jgi:hypothetical protein
MSAFTVGSLFSWIVTAAVVCGQNTQASPDEIPLFLTAARTKAVMSIISLRRVVRTSIVSAAAMRLVLAQAPNEVDQCAVRSTERVR